MVIKRRALLGGLAGAPALGLNQASAQPAASDSAGRFPDRPVRFVVAYAAGGAADNQNRLAAQKLTEIWGKQVIVENKPGGNTLIATETVMRAPADGHTLLSVSLPFALNPLMFDRLPYDPFHDFMPVGLISTIPNILVVHPSFPARNVAEFVAYAKANPQKIAVAHTGIGSVTHLSGELLYDIAGIEVTTVAYTGSAPAHIDVLSGRVQAMFDSSMLPHIAAGRVRALGVTSKQRVALLPDVPTIAEQGFPDYDAVAFYGLVAPRGTPPEIVEKISADLRTAVQQPETQERMKTLTFLPGNTTPAQFDQFIRNEVSLWGDLVKRRKIQPGS
ncbi:MFS transporter [Siccirubricoccus deserti]|uniref:Tripartite tricarboxylate transporter substrate binding protein n=1 Tax=Siccirubricoccus deserti TaxID=2013562 RepID=A0A9X0R4N4_9PROT|nr:tripartite tricarboxylate transporter substrate binding protein [Siccirubricoccus deserti]MBC4018408.1 tripartite tricarboxylate transporter substrate binding protein [Siccirubricoccus deserti]GGC65434.1 MFS transporter [Siccirubricoccus deserti]